MKIILGLLLTFLTFSFTIKENKAPYSKFNLAKSSVKPPTDCTSPTSNFEKVICLANAFKATLSTSQVATLQISYSLANAQVWSNLPASFVPRLGIKLGDLTATQLAAAKELIKAISGTTVNEGWDEAQQLFLADDNLSANGGGNSYGAGNYYLSFFGTPATTGTFEILMGGHHITIANTYINGVLKGATPHFEATEPTSFTVGTTTYAPIDQEKNALAAMMNGLSATDLATAKLSSTFGDVLLGPGKDWVFPTTKQGLKCSGLSAAQKTLVLNAIKTYVLDIDDINAARILTQYTNELDATYIAFAGTPNLSTQNDYIRIDGPSVWIEFTVQGGIIYRNNVHYHSIWRDRVNDYGNTGGPTTTATIESLNAANTQFALGLNFPNPFSNTTTIPFTLYNASKVQLKIFDILGREILVLNTKELPAGNQEISFDRQSKLTDITPGVYLYRLTVENSAGKFVQSKPLIVN